MLLKLLFSESQEEGVGRERLDETQEERGGERQWLMHSPTSLWSDLITEQLEWAWVMCWASWGLRVQWLSPLHLISESCWGAEWGHQLLVSSWNTRDAVLSWEFPKVLWESRGRWGWQYLGPARRLHGGREAAGGRKGGGRRVFAGGGHPSLLSPLRGWNQGKPRGTELFWNLPEAWNKLRILLAFGDCHEL